MDVHKVNLNQKFSQFSDYWSPKIAGELNGQQVKLAKFKGEFPWHSHEHEDELFLVIHGEFILETHQQSTLIKEGEFIIVPRGVEHRPIAEKEAWVLLFEPAGTLNTGNITNEYTKKNPGKI